ncbi:MAG: signal peptidase II, partial [Clostridia bacterium]|nr:signal peptidase II [Clostridia bacterium]
LQLTHVHNYAAAFSMFGGMRIPIIIVTCIVCVVIIVALIINKPRSAWQRFALMLVLGGAVGNLIDRIALGYVVDMFQTLFVKFPVFNIADCAIVVGGILFCICIIAEDTGKKKKKVEPFSQSESDEIYEKLKEFAPMEAEDEPADKGDA